MSDITTNPADEITEDSATLNGEVTNLDDDGVLAGFQWRAVGDGSWTETSTTAIESNQTFDNTITGLTKGTEYEFRAFGDLINIGITTDTAANVGDAQATLRGEITSMRGVGEVDVWFEWGETGQSFPNSTADQTLTSPQSFSEVVTGLSGDTEYEYRAHAEGAQIGVQGGTETYTTESTSPYTLIESWEVYNDGDVVNEIPEWGESGEYTVESATDVHNSLAAGYVVDEPWHNEVLSLEDGSASGQSETYASYPTPNCTIRFAFRMVGSFEQFGGMLFNVPNGESSNVSNGYYFEASKTNGDARIRKVDGGDRSTIILFDQDMSLDTTYDIAVEVEDTGSAVDFDTTIYEWGGSSWTEWDTGTGTDSDYLFPSDAGIGLIGIAGDNATDSGFVVDNIRFADSLNESGTPEWDP